MFGRKKEPKPTPRSNAGGQRAKNQLGLLDMGGMMDFDPSSMDDLYGDDDDDDLEAELLGIMSGKNKAPTNRPKRKGPVSLEAMVAASMKDIPSDEEDNGSDLENDAALLAELQELTPEETTPEDFPATDQSPSPPKMPSPVRPARSAPAPPGREGGAPMLMADLINHTDLLDTPPEIPPKSAALSVVGLLEERHNLYQTAIANAKLAGETSKVRRLERGLKTLESQLKSAKAGKTVNEEDIPPVVATGASAARSPAPAPLPSPERLEEPVETSLLAPSAPPVSPEHVATPEPPAHVPSPVIPVVKDIPERPQAIVSEASSDDTENVRLLLLQRKEQYKQAALQAKQSGDKVQAITYIRIVKQFEAVTGALEQGQPIDLSQMPPPPPGFEANSHEFPTAVVMASNPAPTPRTTVGRPQGSAAVAEPAQAVEEVPIPDGPPDPSLFNAPPAPTSILEALVQRRDKYLSSQKEAQEQENSSKARRMGRIVKQYDDAIKMYKAGKPVQYDDLPDPPGFAPIPRDGQGAALQPSTGQAPQAPPRPAVPAPHQHPPNSAESSDTSAPGGAPPPAPVRKAPGSAPTVPPAASLQPMPQQPGDKVPSPRSTATTRQEKQLQLLLHRQQMFREAALEAKKRGDIPAAKEYLRQSKGFGPMIEASKCGLPVNLDSAPVPPQMTHDDSFEVVEHEDCQPPGDRDEIFERLDRDLRMQIAMCIRNRDHFAQLGDVASSNKFQQLGENSKKDLTSVKYANKRGDAAPRFHYEMKTFSIVQCFTDLTDNELDLTIVRGLNYACPNPKEVDTFVRFEFPFPTENPPHDRTHVVKDTNNPEYNKSFTLPLARKSRALLRTFKRGTIKLEVISKGGFLRSSVVLGTVHVKLAPLETKCLIHDCFDLMDGRKPVGGKLEVKVRIRDPLLSKQVEEIKEKWLVIDEYAGK